MKTLLMGLAVAAVALGQVRVVALPGRSPLVTFRFVFTQGAASDPAGKPGLAYITAMMLANGGTRQMSYQQVVDAMYPMATDVTAQVDQEMTTFSGSTHTDNLETYYGLFRAMLLEPGWRQEDFERVKDDAVNFLRVNLRANNDEELGKEVLYQTLYRGTPYAQYAVGTVSSIQALTLADVKTFYRDRYHQGNLIAGLAGGYGQGFAERVKKDFAVLPKGAAPRAAAVKPAEPERTTALVVDKDTRSVAYSLGFPIAVTRAHPDYPALLVATAYFGPHRTSGGVLYDRMREKRGLNYGDYAYIEYFPRGMYQFEPDPNLARRSQIFQIWIRPVEPPTAVFALRLALHELDKLVNSGLSEEAFQRSREFVSKYVNLLTKTKRAELGYRIDSLFYGIPDYNAHIRKALAKLTREQVNAAIKKHLRVDRLQIVAIARDAEELKARLASGAPSPMTYNSPKPPEITEEDQRVEKRPLGLRAEDVTVVPVDKVFE